jgi:hypothetical protein
MGKPLLVDLCCKAGGASKGYSDAGFDVVGVDIQKQKNYPFKFIRGDVLEMDLPEADLYHASPPCQLFSIGTAKYRNQGKQYPDVLTPLRERLLKTGKPFIIENVPGAPIRKDVFLCGEMFALRVIRHRIFEIHGFTVLQPPHIKHKLSLREGSAVGVYGSNGTLFMISHKANYKEEYEKLKKHRQSWYATVAGNGGNSYSYQLSKWREAMGIDWMNKKELTQAIPPAYTKYIGTMAILNFQAPEITN